MACDTCQTKLSCFYIGRCLQAPAPDVVTTEQQLVALHDVVRRLRKALQSYAKPDVGWEAVEHADAYEASRELVPDDDEERASRQGAQS